MECFTPLKHEQTRIVERLGEEEFQVKPLHSIEATVNVICSNPEVDTYTEGFQCRMGSEKDVQG